MTRVHTYALAALVFIVDQLVKLWVIEGLRLHQRITSIEVLPFFKLTWVENRGVSMGLLTADSETGRWLLVALTAAIAVAVAWWIARQPDRIERLALGLVLGGALGNIVDRVRFGYVVDFVHLHWSRWSFYVFNVADAAITIGVALLLLRSVFGTGRQPRVEDRT